MNTSSATRPASFIPRKKNAVTNARFLALIECLNLINSRLPKDVSDKDAAKFLDAEEMIKFVEAKSDKLAVALSKRGFIIPQGSREGALEVDAAPEVDEARTMTDDEIDAAFYASQR